MRTIDYIDIIEFCKLHNNKLDNVRVYGKITDVIPEPISLRPDVIKDEGIQCYNFEAIAINLGYYAKELKSLGLEAQDNIYFVNGSMGIFAYDTIMVNDWYMCSGTFRLATRVQDSSVAAMFNFYRVKEDWGVHPTTVYNLDGNHFTDGNRVLEYIMKSDDAGSIIYPDEVLNISRFYSDNKNISVSNTSNLPNDMDDQKPEPINAVNESSSYSLDFSSSEGLDLKESLEVLKSIDTENADKRAEFAAELRSRYALTDTNKYTKYCFKKLADSYTTQNRLYYATGKSIIKGYLSSCGVNLNQDYQGLPLWGFLSDTAVETLNKFADDLTISEEDINATGFALRVVNKYLKNREVLYAGVLSHITGVSALMLTSVAKYLYDNKISFSKLVNENAYLLGILSDKITFEECEYLAMCLGHAESDEDSISSKSIQSYRGILAILTMLRSSYNFDSYLSIKDLESRILGSFITHQRYEKISETGICLSENTQSMLKDFICAELTDDSFRYTDKSSFITKYSGYIRVVDKSCLSKAIQDGIKLGVLVQFMFTDDETGIEKLFVSDFKQFSMEFDFYSNVHRLSDNDKTSDYATETIMSYIYEFEESSNVKLQDVSRNGVIFCVNRHVLVLDCIYGSDKMTVFSCIAYVLKKLKADSDFNYICYSGASTEYRKSYSYDFFAMGTNTSSISSADFIIFDNAECLSMESAVQMLSCVKGNAYVIFAGDKNRVVGSKFEKFYRDIYRLLPHICLSCTSESGISNNAVSILSGGSVHTSGNCAVIDCDNEDIPIITSLLCKYHEGSITEAELNVLQSKVSSENLLSGTVKPRDISVVTSVDKETYNFGSYNMNNILRGVFNTSNTTNFIWKSSSNDKSGVMYRLGDRVLHTSGYLDCQRYDAIDGTVFKQSSKTGISEGSVGVVYAIYPASICVFDSCNADSNSLRSDSTFAGKDRYFVVVRYYDTESKAYFYVLYHAYLSSGENSDVVTFVGGDRNRFKLFYCGTTQKSFTHRNKLIISLVGNTSNTGFVTRNMLYSQWSLAKDMLYIIGDVGVSSSSQLTEARKFASLVKGKSIGGLL